jgi:hypothetical protein
MCFRIELPCTPMFIAPLFIIAKLWQQPRCPTAGKWIKKMWYIHIVEFYSAKNENKIMLFAGKWMKLENFVLSVKNQMVICFLSYVESRPIS